MVCKQPLPLPFRAIPVAGSKMEENEWLHTNTHLPVSEWSTQNVFLVSRHSCDHTARWLQNWTMEVKVICDGDGDQTCILRPNILSVWRQYAFNYQNPDLIDNWEDNCYHFISGTSQGKWLDIIKDRIGDKMILDVIQLCNTFLCTLSPWFSVTFECFLELLGTFSHV